MAVFSQFRRTHRSAGKLFDKGGWRLSPTYIRTRHNGRHHYGGMKAQYVFNLEAGNVLASRNDDVLAAIFDLQIAIRILDCQISCVEHPWANASAVASGFCR